MPPLASATLVGAVVGVLFAPRVSTGGDCRVEPIAHLLFEVITPKVAMSPLTKPDLKISLIRLLKHILYGFRLCSEWYIFGFGGGLNRMKRRN